MQYSFRGLDCAGGIARYTSRQRPSQRIASYGLTRAVTPGDLLPRRSVILPFGHIDAEGASDHFRSPRRTRLPFRMAAGVFATYRYYY